MDKRILFAHVGGHPTHRKFAATVTKKSVRASWNLSKNYDIYLIESGFIKPVLLKISGRINKKSKIINLFADPRLYYLKQKKFFDLKKSKVKNYPKWKLFLTKFLLKKLDGALCIGKSTGDLFREYNKKSPMKIIYGFIPKDNYKKLIKIKPDLKNYNILFVGNGPDPYCKGIDLLIDTFKFVKKKVPNAKLYILGKWQIKKDWKLKDVYFEGEREIVPYLKKCSISLHLGRGDCFPGSVLEILLAGVPVIISKHVGTKEIVERVNKKLVVPLNKKIISDKIIKYFNLSLKQKKVLSEKGRDISKEFNEKNMLKYFRKQFQNLIKEIYKNENTYNQ